MNILIINVFNKNFTSVILFLLVVDLEVSGFY